MFIDILAKNVLESLADHGSRIQNPEPLMRDIAAVMEAAVMYNFDTEGRGEWPALSSHFPRDGKLLQDTRLLAGSISSRHSAIEAIVNTNDPKAPTHQFGAEQGQYGQTERGAPIPFGDIPARPFLFLGEDDVEEIDELVAAHYRF